jgi:hypothetical protein
MFKWFRKLKEWLGCTKRVEYTFGGVPFACYVGCGCFNGMVEVTVYEIRPNKKIFKEKYLDSKWFWLDDHKTIKDGVLTKLCEMLEERKKELEKQDKWKEFYEENP